MTKKIEGFQCEKCNTIFDNEYGARSCEEGHIVPEFVEYTYIKGRRLPDTVKVKYKEHGTTYEHEFS